MNYFMILYYVKECSQIIRMLGPLGNIQATRSEATHRKAKLGANSVSTRINICKTIAMKQQLIFSNKLLPNQGSDSEFASGHLREFSAETANELETLTNYKANDYLGVDSVKIYNTQYKFELFIRIDGDDEFSTFAQIKEILIFFQDNDIHFCYNPFKTLYFSEHIFAHKSILNYIIIIKL